MYSLKRSASSLSEDDDTDNDIEISFGALRKAGRLQKKMSKFEKHGPTLTDALMTELRKIENEDKPETKLEKYQIEAVLEVKKHFAEEWFHSSDPRMALVVAPPGSGKSGMVFLLPYVLQSHKVLILTPSKIISQQLGHNSGYPNKSVSFFVKSKMFKNHKECSRMLEKVGLAITPKDVKDFSKSNLVIVNAQKFGGRSLSSLSNTWAGRTQAERDRVEKQLRQFDTIIVDEAHHYPAQTWRNIIDCFERKKVIFLTATPFRGNIQMSQFLKRDLKVVYEIKRHELEGKTIRSTEFIEKFAFVQKLSSPKFMAQLRKDIRALIFKLEMQEPLASRNQALILVRTKVEAKQVADGLGSDATAIFSDKYCQRNLEEFAKGEKNIAVVCGMLREGYDNTNVSLVVILRKCKSRVLFEQFCGRCMRMDRTLTEDRRKGIVMSYVHFNQRPLWEMRLQYSEEEPEEESEEDLDYDPEEETEDVSEEESEEDETEDVSEEESEEDDDLE